MSIEVIGWTSHDNEKYPVAELDSVEVRDAIVEDIRANGYEFNGVDHQYHESCTPVLNNGKRICCSQRQWGGLMAYAHKVDVWDENAYLFYFLTDVENPCYPLDKVNDDVIVLDDCIPKKADRSYDESPDREEFEFRKFRLQNFSARLFRAAPHQYHTLTESFEDNAALITAFLIKIVSKTKNECYAQKCVDSVKQIMSYWITEDGLSMKDKRLSHLETKFEGGRVDVSLSEYCPPDFKSSYAERKDDLIPFLYFLFVNCPHNEEFIKRLFLHLNNLFEYSVLYQIESINSDIPKEVIA